MNAQETLSKITRRIALACEKADRNPTEVQLLAVSKTFPAEAVENFARQGQYAFGENYLQEAVDKITQLTDTPELPSLQWHFIGPIQSNKTRPIAQHFDWVHSVDRLKIAQRLSEQRPDHLPDLQLLVQVNTSGEHSKSGVAPEATVQLCQKIDLLPKVNLRGLMTLPSNTSNTEALRQEFLTCNALLTELQQAGLNHADTLSMGMSSDLELAIKCGSTCVRIGTALFGKRTHHPNSSTQET